MRLYLVDGSKANLADGYARTTVKQAQFRMLLSYWYYGQTDLERMLAEHFPGTRRPSMFADSGGFSAETQGAEITCEEYAAWVKRWGHLFDAYANLDVIGDHKATMENQRRLEAMGLAPVPVFHIGSDYAVLERLVEEYTYIALGGLVPHLRYTQRVMKHLVQCFRIAGDKAVFHGFGVTSWTVLKSLPWYSVDSSSWGAGFRYGRVPIFDSKQGRFYHLQLGDAKAWYRHSALVRALGFNPADFADRKRNDRAKLCAIAAVSYMEAEQWLRQWHGEIRIPARTEREKGAPGGRIYLCDNPNSGDVARARRTLQGSRKANLPNKTGSDNGEAL